MNYVKGKIWQTRTETSQPSLLQWTPMLIKGHASHKIHKIVMSVTFRTILYYKVVNTFSKGSNEICQFSALSKEQQTVIAQDLSLMYKDSQSGAVLSQGSIAPIHSLSLSLSWILHRLLGGVESLLVVGWLLCSQFFFKGAIIKIKKEDRKSSHQISSVQTEGLNQTWY